jgi:hypothetical protein
LLIAAAVACSLLGYVVYARLSDKPSEGCRVYPKTNSPLIAHAGGGLPNKFYANNLEALNLAYSHGHRMFELDFIELDGHLLVGHEIQKAAAMTLAELLAWMDAHPDATIVTDMKSNNLEGLRLLKEAAGSKVTRIIPQIRFPEQYKPVREMGYPAPILSIYFLGKDGWQTEVNQIPLFAVAMPAKWRDRAKGIRHPIYLYTVNQPLPGYGLYTDCLIPS